MQSVLVAANAIVVVNTLLAQYAFYPYGKEEKVGEAENRYPVRIVDTYRLHIGQFAL
jgi:hypothetical protein